MTIASEEATIESVTTLMKLKQKIETDGEHFRDLVESNSTELSLQRAFASTESQKNIKDSKREINAASVSESAESSEHFISKQFDNAVSPPPKKRSPEKPTVPIAKLKDPLQPLISSQASEIDTLDGIVIPSRRIPSKPRAFLKPSGPPHSFNLEYTDIGGTPRKMSSIREEAMFPRQSEEVSTVTKETRPVATPVIKRKSIQSNYPMTCPLCGSTSGAVTESNLEIWAAGASDRIFHMAREPGMEAFALLEKYIKSK